MTHSFLAFGSSHLGSKNGIQLPLQQLLTDSRNYDRSEFYPVGGGRLDDATVETIMQKIDPQQQTHILIMYGSNDLRYDDSGLNALLDRLQSIIDITMENKNIAVFIPSIIPCPRTDKKSRKHYCKFNSRVKSMVKDKDRTIFINTTKHLFKTFGPQFLSELYKKDKLHLNSRGAEEVANYIFKVTNTHTSST